MGQPQVQIASSRDFPPHAAIPLPLTTTHAARSGTPLALPGQPNSHAQTLAKIIPAERGGGVLSPQWDGRTAVPGAHLDRPAVCSILPVAYAKAVARRRRRRQRARSVRLLRAYRRQLRFAARVQRNLLPTALPRLNGFAFDAAYRPANYVSGDIYDVRCLDSDHVAVGLADVEGHGAGAGLLSAFVQRGLRCSDPLTESSVPRPDSVLERLNGDLLQAELTECGFVAAIYVVINTRTRSVALARAGAPYPLLRSADGCVRFIRSSGTLMGIEHDTRYDVCRFRLDPGDSLILYTDGLEQVARCAWAKAVSAGASHTAPGPPDEQIATTEWFHTLRMHGARYALHKAGRRHDLLRRHGDALDDLTILSVRAGHAQAAGQARTPGDNR